MKAAIICPDRRAEVAFLARKRPLALAPVLGPTLLDHWLTALADGGAKEVTILASDRPDHVRRAVGRGEKWGLRVEMRAEPREWSAEEARARLGVETAVVADRLPSLPDTALFDGHAGFFDVLRRWMPSARQHRVGAREIAPGVWAGLGSRIDSGARLLAPCWLGENVWVRAGATVGPETAVEDCAVVDHDAEVTGSWIGPCTYVGAMTHVNRSLAWADGLLNLENGSFTEIVDLFLLGDLRGARSFRRSSPWYGRAAALLAALATSPLLLVAAARTRGTDRPLLARRTAVLPTAVATGAALREMAYAELNGVRGLARRWPQLWGIVRGEFTWVGNRPLDRDQAAQLVTEFEQLWLAAPVGLLSLADAHGCGDRFDDESRAHSGFYAVRGDARMDRAVLRWFLFGSLPSDRR